MHNIVTMPCVISNFNVNQESVWVSESPQKDSKFQDM